MAVFEATVVRRVKSFGARFQVVANSAEEARKQFMNMNPFEEMDCAVEQTSTDRDIIAYDVEWHEVNLPQ